MQAQDNSLKKNTFSLKKIKNSQVKELVEKLSLFYGCNLDFLLSYNFYINKNRGKVYISEIDLSSFHVTKFSSVGIYFGSFHDGDRFRLSIEGSTFISPTKNCVKINFDTLKSYLAAENLFKSEVLELDWQDNAPFLIVIFKNEHLGCVSLKDDLLLTYLPKSRKLDYNKVF